MDSTSFFSAYIDAIFMLLLWTYFFHGIYNAFALIHWYTNCITYWCFVFFKFHTGRSTCMPPSAPLAMNVSEYAAQVFRYRGFNCTKTGIDNLQTCQSCLAGTFGGRDKGHCELCPEGKYFHLKQIFVFVKYAINISLYFQSNYILIYSYCVICRLVFVDPS